MILKTSLHNLHLSTESDIQTSLETNKSVPLCLQKEDQSINYTHTTFSNIIYYFQKLIIAV
jgi:hypothetical protein